jgi:hypothetical protein
MSACILSTSVTVWIRNAPMAFENRYASMASHGLQKGLPYALVPSPLPVNRTIHGCWPFLTGGETKQEHCVLSVRQEMQSSAQTGKAVLSEVFLKFLSCRPAIIPKIGRWTRHVYKIWKIEFPLAPRRAAAIDPMFV